MKPSVAGAPADPEAGTLLSVGVPGVFGRSDILVVDDNPTNVTLITRILREAGAQRIRAFTEPREALSECVDRPPDIVLLDWHMPTLDGLSFIKALGGLLPPGLFLPVVVLTADVTAAARREALAAGAKDFLTKPFDREEIVLRVRNLLETRALYRRLEDHNAELRATIAQKEAAAHDAAVARERTARRIDDVLATGAFHMVFQPVADLSTGEVVGAEALARFDTEPVRPPNVWFSEAADAGRGTALELAAVAAALRQLNDLPPGAFLSVNVSPATMCAAGLRSMLAGVAADRLVLEITEHTRIDEYSPVIGVLAGLRRSGVRIAVDDAGAGYSGLQQILRIRPDMIKLDISLTRGIAHDPIRRSLAAALVAFAKEVNAVLVAEGIEIVGELVALRNLGVPLGQGYHLARPGGVPIPTLLEQVATTAV